MRVEVRIRGWMWGWVLLGGAAAGLVAQQAQELTPPAGLGAELRGLASRAGVVFVGQVAKIEPKDGVVEVTFTVEQPILGVTGGSYVMREWAGRWTGGQQRFMAGQRAMYFLHAPNAAGLSSAVDGMVGVVPVVPTGAEGLALLDVRWLATRVKRTAGISLPGTESGAIALADGVSVTKKWQAEAMGEPKLVALPEQVAGHGTHPQPQRPGQAVELDATKGAVDAQR